MSENRTIRVTNGAREFVFTPAEYRSYVASLPKAARANVQVLSGDIPSITQNQAGELVRESLSHEAVSNLVDRGEDPVITGADDPALQAFNRQEKARTAKATSDDENILQAANKATPFIGQYLQNLAVGEDVATQARQELNAANPVLGLGMDLAMLARGGITTGKTLQGTKLGAALGANRGAAGVAALTAKGAAADTYLYTQYLLDNNLPFTAEDYASELLVGALVTLPFAGAAAVRGAAVRGGIAAGKAIKGAAAGGLPGAINLAADAGVGLGIAAPGIVGREVFRGAAAGRVIGRALQRIRGKKVTSAPHVNQVAQAESAAKAQLKTIGNFTPEKLRRMTPSARAQAINDVAGVAGRNADDLHSANFETAHDRVSKMRSNVETVRKQALSINQKLGKGGAAQGPLDIGQEARYIANADAILGNVEAAGFSDITNYLKPLVNSSAPGTTYGAWVQARLDAALKRGTTGGASQVDDALRGFLENKDIWGPQAAQSRALNDAIDTIVSSREKLAELNIPKNLENIQGVDAGRLTNISKEIDAVRKAYAIFEERGFLSRSQVRGVERTLIEAQEAVTSGTQAYLDVTKVNKMREQAAALTTERLSQVAQATEDVAALRAESVFEEASKIDGLKKILTAKNIEKALAGIGAANIGGVIALREMKRQEVDDIFNIMQQVLPSYTGNPEALEEVTYKLLSPTNLSDPNGSMLAGISMGTSVFHLAQSMPRNNNSLYPNRKTPRSQKWAFMNRLSAAINPVSVAYAAVEGRVTPEMIETIKVTRPAMYAELGVMLSEVLTQKGVDGIPRRTLGGIQKFIGGLDPLYQGATLIRLQTNSAQNQQQQQLIPGNGQQPQQPLSPFRDASNPQDGNDFTFTQRITSF